MLYHECVHYALYTLNKPFRDSDAEFIQTWMLWGFLKREVITIKTVRIYMNVQMHYISLLKLKATISDIFAYCRSKFVYRRELRLNSNN